MPRGSRAISDPHPPIAAEVVDPAGLSAPERDAFVSLLYGVHQEIFAGVSPDQFARYILRPDAVRTRVQIYRNELGAMIGYCAVHLFEVAAPKHLAGVFRAEAGLLPLYRGAGTTLWFGAKEAFRYKVRHPWRTVALFAMPVHPSSYHMLSKYFWHRYPRPDAHTPERWRALLLELVRSSGVDAVDPAEPLVRRVGWTTRESAEAAAAWRENPHADIRYYLSRNPDYALGHGLAIIAPLSIGNFGVSFVHYAWHFVVRWIGSFGRPAQP